MRAGGGTDACVRVAAGKSRTYRLPESLYHGIIYHRKKGSFRLKFVMQAEHVVEYEFCLNGQGGLL